MDAVIFDMDGVILVDSEERWHAREQDLYRRMIAEDVDPATVCDRFAGINYRELYDAIADAYTVTMDREAFLGWFEGTVEEVYGGATVMEGFADLVRMLQGAGLRVGVATSSPHAWIGAVTDRVPLYDLADAVVSAEDVDGPGKPDPGIYRRAAAALDVAPERCVAVEDSLNGARAAVDAGMYTVAFAPGTDETAALADVVVEDAASLRETLRAVCDLA